MARGFEITPPFFEIGPKAYLYGEQALALARHADAMSAKYGVQIIFTPQSVDIRLLASEMQRVLVFAQHMDSLEVGRGIGSVLPEAVKAAGAAGVLLNHAEKKLTMDELQRTMERADQVGLAAMVCADNLEQAIAIAKLQPDIIIAESPELIGVGKRGQNDQQAIVEDQPGCLEYRPDDSGSSRGRHKLRTGCLRYHRSRRAGRRLHQRDHQGVEIPLRCSKK